MKHVALVETTDTAHRGRCPCGWRGIWDRSKRVALAHADAHAEAKNACRKFGFATEAEAADAVLKAKIARGLKGNRRRREERAYFCAECTAYHLTSLAAVSS